MIKSIKIILMLNNELKENKRLIKKYKKENYHKSNIEALEYEVYLLEKLIKKSKRICQKK